MRFRVIALAAAPLAATMPNCRLITIPGIGHSMNLGNPALYAGYVGTFFGGLAR